MPIVTSDFLAAMMTGFRTIFNSALEEAGKITQLKDIISTQMGSDTDKETYAWMGSPPTMSEWKDQRQYKAIKAYSYSLTNKHFEGTIEVDRNTYEDNKYGQLAPRIRGLANRAVRHMNQLTIDKLDAGATDLAYDEAAMFTDSRTIGDSATIDNILQGAYSGSTTEVLAALRAASTLMQNYTDDKGVKMGLFPDTIVAAPAMAMLIKEALLPAVAGTVRPERDVFNPDRVFSSPLIDADILDWYILCTVAEVKPLIFQLRKAPEFVALDNPQSDHVFKNKTFLYGVDDRFVVGYGDPRTAIKVVDQ